MASESNGGPGSKPVHVLEIIGNAIVGGAENYVRTLVDHLPSSEFRVTCLCPFESEYTRNLREKGYDVFIVPMREEPQWDAIQSAVSLVRTNEIDLIHSHLTNAHILGGLAGCITQKPVVTTIHGIYFSSREFSVSRTTGTHLIAVCQEAYNFAVALGMPPQRVTLIRNGVDLDTFQPGGSGEMFRAALGVPPNTPLVGFVGRLNREKGPDTFLQLAARVHAFRQDVHFVMVGDGPMADDLCETIRRLDLQQHVHMAGPWKSTQSVYPALDILAQTSRAEGMPLVILEAMACGVPVVAHAVGGVAEMVEMGTNGFLFGDLAGSASAFPGEYEGGARAVLLLLSDPERRRRMGQAGRQRAEKLFDIREVANRTGSLFQQLVDSRLAGFGSLLQMREKNKTLD